MLTKNLLSKIIKTAKEKKKIVIVDPKNRDFGIYSNANIITPNLKELFEATDTKSLSSNLLIEKLSKKIINLYGFETVITTRSSEDRKSTRLNSSH